MQQLLDIQKQGYGVDPSKPNNILIQPKAGFNLVDLNPTQRPPNAGDIIIMLMNNPNFYTAFANDESMKEVARQIINKVETAAKDVGVPLNMDPSVQYSYELAGKQ